MVIEKKLWWRTYFSKSKSIKKCHTVKFFCKENSNMAYSFQGTVAPRGYRVYKNTTWEETKCADKFWLTKKRMENQ